MDVETLLSKGYLPKELPPPFSSESFADSSAEIRRKWLALPNGAKKNFKESICAKYSIPRVNYSRRVISIPNPLHQQELVECIAANWAELSDFCKKSRLSASKPVEDVSRRRAVVTARKFSEYKRAYVKDSFDRLYEIRTDIARFFPSIYTHSLSWALDGKDKAIDACIISRPPSLRKDQHVSKRND